MNGQINNAEYDFLRELLANPADNNRSYSSGLQSLVSDFPQSGVLRALLMPNGDTRHAKQAAAYFNPGLLHKLATAPDSLPKVSNEQIIFTERSAVAPSDVHYNNIPQAEPFVPSASESEEEYAQLIDDDEPVAENSVADTQSAFIEPIVVTRVEPQHIAEVTPLAFHEEPEQQPVIEQPAPYPLISSHEDQKNDLAKEYEAYMAKTDITPSEPVSSYGDEQVRYFHQPIEDEVYDEIVSIEDIGLEQLAILNKSAQQHTGDENYFVFEPEITGYSNQQTEPAPQLIQQPEPVVLQELPTEVEYPNPYFKDELSKYNDEKMPYTFMWWLDKTRKEHAYIYQPYAHVRQVVTGPAQQGQPQQRPVVDELQQQYYQSIVANTSITDLDKAAPLVSNAHVTRKEDKIIERFIQDEPHIKHPTDVKLDNENKAKRSSEDKEELVTETLARIYTEQMLYHKAIITYKKLMLKYPEKSLYFASQIEQLENKIN
ncbi:MAG TPA: hypothetical protein VNW51_10515 [Mucilaginibacter sp.]|nr:hypothetical protein [Mucilaginibacter sp.]